MALTLLPVYVKVRNITENALLEDVLDSYVRAARIKANNSKMSNCTPQLLACGAQLLSHLSVATKLTYREASSRSLQSFLQTLARVC